MPDSAELDALEEHVSESRPFHLNFAIRKVDEERGIIEGAATSEVLDLQDEIVDHKAATRAFKRWTEKINEASRGKSKGNLREMHSPVVVGHVVHWHPDDEKREQFVRVKVNRETDEGANAWRKVVAGELNGFSIGAPSAKREMDYHKGRAVRRVVDFEMAELSLVDNPACPGSFFTMVKTETLGGVGQLVGVAKGAGEITADDLVGIEKRFITLDELRALGAKAIAEKRWKPKTKAQEAWISEKIKTLMGEGKKQDQAIAVAYSMAREKFDPESKEAAVNIRDLSKKVDTDLRDVQEREKKAREEADAKAALEKRATEEKAAAEKAAAEKAGRTIGPVHRTGGGGKAEAETPSVETGKLPEEAIPHVGKGHEPGKEVDQESSHKDAGFERPANESEDVSEPKGQGADSKAAGDPAAHKPADPADGAHKEAEARYAYCAMCGKSKDASAMPYHKECREPKKEAAAGNDDLKKFIGDQNEGLRKTVLAKFEAQASEIAELRAKVEKLEAQPTPGGPKRAELPSAVQPVTKGQAISDVETAATPQAKAEALEKAQEFVDDPVTRDKLGQRAAQLRIRQSFGG